MDTRNIEHKMLPLHYKINNCFFNSVDSGLVFCFASFYDIPHNTKYFHFKTKYYPSSKMFVI